MKLAVIKIGARIAAGKSTSGGATEALSIIKMLVDGGAEVHAFSKFLKKDEPIPSVEKHQINDWRDKPVPQDYDALVVINGNVNFFGGAEDPSQILNYKFINGFKGKVFYVLCDPTLPLTQIWPSVKKKEWGKNWKQEEIEVTRKDIVYISQAYDLEAVDKLLKKTKIEVADIVHYPTHFFPLQFPTNFSSNDHKVDLIYGGTFRGGKREEKMIKYYFGNKNISVEMFGKIEPKRFKKTLPKEHPQWAKAVEYTKFISRLKDGLATCIIGDKWYEGRHITQRIYEGILAGVITFIDIDFDPQRKIFENNKKLQDFLYVSSRQELEDKIIMLKNKIRHKNKKPVDLSKESYHTDGDRTLRLLQKMQYDAVKIDWEKYCKKFTDLFIDIINKD